VATHIPIHKVQVDIDCARGGALSTLRERRNSNTRSPSFVALAARWTTDDLYVDHCGMSHHRAGQGQLLLLWVAVATAASLSGHVAQHEDGARGTCDFRLAESTRYSHWISPLGALGVSANTTLNVNGEDLGSGPYRGVCVSPPTFGSHAERWTGHNVSLEDFLAQDAATVRKLISQNVLPVVHGGASTTSLLVIDIEEPARPDGFHALNHSTLVRVVDALRLRVAALKHAMPRCSVSFYGKAVAVCLNRSKQLCAEQDTCA
jgi:hypothetical protein